MMNDEEKKALEEFRQSLMKDAYSGFLTWACGKEELMDEYLKFLAEGNNKTFKDWVTETYWGSVE